LISDLSKEKKMIFEQKFFPKKEEKQFFLFPKEGSKLKKTNGLLIRIFMCMNRLRTNCAIYILKTRKHALNARDLSG